MKNFILGLIYTVVIASVLAIVSGSFSKKPEEKNDKKETIEAVQLETKNDDNLISIIETIFEKMPVEEKEQEKIVEETEEEKSEDSISRFTVEDILCLASMISSRN